MISVVIPVYNEGENLHRLSEMLGKVLKEIDHEIIFIDDGSTDKTFEILRGLHEKDNKIKVIRFRKNFGQTAAIQAGFDYAKGDVIVTMDGDLQNDPEDIPKLVEKINEGYSVVSGWRYNRNDPFLTKKIPSKFSNYMARKLTGIKIHDFGCSLKAYKKEVLWGIRLYGEMHRYIPALVAMNGFSVAEIKVKHHPRKYGKTKYGMKRLIKGFLDLIYIKFWSSYSTRPLHFFGVFGLILIFGSFSIVFEKVVIELLLLNMPLNIGPLLLLSVLLFITGIQFIIFGFLGEIMIRTYYENSNKKNYNIKEILE